MSDPTERASTWMLKLIKEVPIEEKAAIQPKASETAWPLFSVCNRPITASRTAYIKYPLLIKIKKPEH